MYLKWMLTNKIEISYLLSFVHFAVGNQFPGLKAQNESMVPMLGSCLQSWGWDIQRRSIYHAGICIGRYPPLHLGKCTTHAAFEKL